MLQDKDVKKIQELKADRTLRGSPRKIISAASMNANDLIEMMLTNLKAEAMIMAPCSSVIKDE